MFSSRTTRAEDTQRRTTQRLAAVETIAGQLREAREYRHLTLEAVALATRIPPHHIQALEAGQLTALPGRSYTRAFLRTYATYLGLDADELLEMLPLAPTRPPTGYPKPPERPRTSIAFWLAVSGLVLIVSCVGWFAVQAVFRATSPVETGALEPPTPQAVNNSDIPPPPTPTPSVRLIVKGTTNAPAPLQVAINGASVFSGTLAVGENKAWNGDRIRLTTPNGGGVEIASNGEPPRVLGRKDQQVDITIGSAAPTPTGTVLPTATAMPTATPTQPRPTPTGERPR